MQIRVNIIGKVQGVAFRAWTADEAQRLGIDGWVRNRRDGSVEAVFAGTDIEVTRMLELVREGPPAAVVSGVDVVDDESDLGRGFAVLPTD